MSGTTVTLDGTSVVARFGAFDLDSYRRFLQAKSIPESALTYDWQADAYELRAPARYATVFGIEPTEAVTRPALPFQPHLFDYQADIVRLALEAERFSAWCDTGLGKSHILLEWCRQVAHITGGRVLIFQPLQIIRQTLDLAAEWFPDVEIEQLHSREAVAAWCVQEGRGIAITNYEKLIGAERFNELRYCAGIVADESSILKTGGGRIKWALIHSSRGVRFKLSLTATPAPNDTMEFASQASFMEKIRSDSENEVLWTFFSRDQSGEWRVKPHAREAFYRYLAAWSIYLRDPARFGWANVLANLPDPEIHEITLPLSDEQRERYYQIVQAKAGMFSDDRMGVQERSALSQLAKGFRYGRDEGGVRTVERIDSAKPYAVAEIVRSEVALGHQVLVWTVFDEESAILAEMLADEPWRVAELEGSTALEQRAATLDGFRRGDVQVLISKAQLVGYGLNFQHCRSMVFSGWDDSFERLYQAVRRCYRLGQTETVRVWFPVIPELEGMTFGNVKRKQARWERDCEEMEAAYIRAMGRGE